MQFLEKVPKKYSKNVVVAQFWQIILKVMPKWKLVRNFYKSKTPLNTPLSTWFFFCWVCICLVFYLHIKHFWKKKIIQKKIFSTSILTSIFGLTSIFFDVKCSKIPKSGIFGKSTKKDPKKWGGCPKLANYFESYGQMKILGRWRQFLTSISLKISENRTFPGETTILSFRTILLAYFIRI